DGGFKRELELPATGVPRTYRARTYGEISQGRLEDLMDGIEIEGVRYGRIDANMERRTGRNQWIELTLTEGKNREVRRVLEHLGLEVSRLIRTAYGPFSLDDLARGAALEVRKEDLERFRSSLKKAGPGRASGFGSAAASAKAPSRRSPRAAASAGTKPARSGPPGGARKHGQRPSAPRGKPGK